MSRSDSSTAVRPLVGVLAISAAACSFMGCAVSERNADDNTGAPAVAQGRVSPQCKWLGGGCWDDGWSDTGGWGNSWGWGSGFGSGSGWAGGGGSWGNPCGTDTPWGSSGGSGWSGAWWLPCLRIGIQPIDGGTPPDAGPLPPGTPPATGSCITRNGAPSQFASGFEENLVAIGCSDRRAGSFTDDQGRVYNYLSAVCPSAQARTLAQQYSATSKRLSAMVPLCSPPPSGSVVLRWTPN